MRPSAVAFAELRLGVRREELPRRGRAPLLAHEQHRRERPEQGERGRDGEAARVERRGEPVAGGAVADLVVVLAERDQPAERDVRIERTAVVPLAEARPGAVVEEAALEHLRTSAPGPAKSA